MPLPAQSIIAAGGTVTPRPPFELIEHTADAGIAVRGATLAELFAHAAEGMFSIIVAPQGVAESERREISVEARDLEGLLVAWLAELLYYVDAEELIFRRFEITEIDEGHLQATAYGEPIDPERHELRIGIKAVTRHMLDVSPEDGGYRATVIFDI